MKMIERTVVDNHTFITMEQSFLFFWKRERKFVADKEWPSGYWNWLEMPNLTLVPSTLSFQLDAWNRTKPSK